MLQHCFQSAQLNGLTLSNRFIKAGTFEGKTPQGLPGEEYHQFHQRIAAGGVGMTTLAYCATEADGRINADMMYMDDYVKAPLTSLIEDLHRSGTKVSGQMGHCGGFSKNTALKRGLPRGPQFGINLIGFPYGMFFCGGMKQKHIDAMVQGYSDAARFMKSVGFDCLEIHFGHGYGLCQFISPKTNKRTDRYGGSLLNRMRLPLEVLEAVRSAVGETFPVVGKISITEGVRGGIHYDEAVGIAQLLDQGGIDGVITSGGSSTMNPMIMFRGGNILQPLLKVERNWLMRLILRAVGPSMFKNYPYKELYFLEHAKRIRDAVSCNVIYVGGASNNESFNTLMKEGFDFIQLGRSLLSDPDLIHQAKRNPDFKSQCTHCNECVATIDHSSGIHCPVFDKSNRQQ